MGRASAGRVILAATAALLLAMGALAVHIRRFRARAVAQLTRSHPDLIVTGLTTTGVRARLGGVAVHIDLASVYRSLRGRADPAALEALLNRVIEALPPPAIPPLPLVRDRLLPLVKPLPFLEMYRRRSPAFQVVGHHFADGLAVVYVVEGLHRVTFVTAAMCAAWGIALSDLHRLALTNLRRKTEHLLAEIGGPRTVYASLDGFDAARVLVSDMVVPAGMEDPMVAIPDEHTLLLAPGSERDRLAGEAASRHARARLPLTPAVFRGRDARLAPDVIS